ncbi:ion channel CASTOR-like isoform X5 [Euphorbia lathyris]|uniref:ion channel CASTOR-like isoform X5 n=1 Tax=Euphorbia lathyris TaxID=212925 RepID=UPI003313B4B7
MSIDHDSSQPPAATRDWFFPSPSFIHHPPPPASSKSRRRFSTASTVSQDLPESRPSSSTSSHYRDKNARLRRRVEFPRRAQRSSKQEQDDTLSARKLDALGDRTTSGETFVGFPGVRWHIAVSAAIVITALASLVHKNFSLHNQVIDLQDHISKLDVRLQACNLLSDVDYLDSTSLETVDHPSEGLKHLALVFSLILLCIPVFVLKYIDFVSKSRLPDNTSEEVLLNKQIAYRADAFLSIHPYAKSLALLVSTLLLICLGGLALFGVTGDSLADCLWLSWTYVADSGNHANSEGIGPRLVSVSISFGGMLIFAMMLGLVSDAISEKFDSLRKGRSEVVEQNHTLVLGWSDKLVSVSKARAIIVLAEDGNADQSDARALRTVLSLTGVKEGLRGHIVVELSDLDNEVLVKLVGSDLVETVVAHDVIGRLMIQCARQPGLAQIWEDILGFENCEFYIKRWPQLDGMQFEDVLISFPDAIPCGVKVASCGGKIILNPDDSYLLQEGDEVLVIAEDDDTYAPATLPTVLIFLQKVKISVWRGSLPKDFVGPNSTEKILFCGWRRDMEDMIMVLDAFLAPGSELWMFNDVPEKEREKKLIDGGLDIGRLVNISLVDREGNAVIRRHLESLPLESFDSILILADESVEDSAIQADSRSLATLLLIRDIQAKRLPFREAMVTQGHRGSFSQGSWIGEMQQASDKSVIISEILDPRTKNLLSMSKISDYVLSNELVSMALAMVAEDRQINDVLEELFAEEGNEMHIRQADLYLREGEELSFYEIILRARQRREIVIGYRAANAERAVINPPSKNERKKWSLKDVFVVIAEKD